MCVCLCLSLSLFLRLFACQSVSLSVCLCFSPPPRPHPPHINKQSNNNNPPKNNNKTQETAAKNLTVDRFGNPWAISNGRSLVVCALLLRKTPSNCDCSKKLDRLCRLPGNCMQHYVQRRASQWHWGCEVAFVVPLP